MSLKFIFCWCRSVFFLFSSPIRSPSIFALATQTTCCRSLGFLRNIFSHDSFNCSHRGQGEQRSVTRESLLFENKRKVTYSNAFFKEWSCWVTKPASSWTVSKYYASFHLKLEELRTSFLIEDCLSTQLFYKNYPSQSFLRLLVRHCSRSQFKRANANGLWRFPAELGWST